MVPVGEHAPPANAWDQGQWTGQAEGGQQAAVQDQWGGNAEAAWGSNEDQAWGATPADGGDANQNWNQNGWDNKENEAPVAADPAQPAQNDWGTGDQWNNQGDPNAFANQVRRNLKQYLEPMLMMIFRIREQLMSTTILALTTGVPPQHPGRTISSNNMERTMEETLKLRSTATSGIRFSSQTTSSIVPRQEPSTTWP